LQQQITTHFKSNSQNPTLQTLEQHENTPFQDILLDKSNIDEYITQRAKLEDWNEFAYEIIDSAPSVLSSKKSDPLSPVTKYIKRTCYEKYALRSWDINEVKK